MMAIMQAIASGGLDGGSDKKKKGKKKGDDSSDPISMQAEKARDLVQNIINTVGPRATVSTKLANAVRIIESSLKDLRELSSPLTLLPANVPLGIGTPGQTPYGGPMMTPVPVPPGSKSGTEPPLPGVKQ